VLASPGPIAFFLGPLPVRWYGLLVAAAIGLGFWLADRQARAARLPADRLLSTAQWAVVAGLVGARLYEVAFNWEYYGRHLDKIPAVWEGGLAIHGGLIAGSLVVVTLAMYGRLPVLRSLDVAAPSIALGQAIGRWGNFFNEEAFGYPTALPWKLYVSPDYRPAGYEVLPLRVPLGPGRVPGARPVAPAEGAGSRRSAILLVPRTVLGRARAHRDVAAGQFLAWGHPGRAVRERGGPGSGRRRTRVDFRREGRKTN
jgi:prolipoprotein diacylglyceryltransferase